MKKISDLAVEKTAERFGSAIVTSLEAARGIATNEQYLGAISVLPGAGPLPFIRWIANEIDPTGNAIYSTWLIRRWIAGDFRFLEDLFKARSALELFDKAKPRLPIEQRDINKYKSFGALDALVDTLAPTDLISGKEQERAIERDLISSGQAEIFHNDAEAKIIIPRTEAASCYFGRNTKWCTAAKSNNKFEYYSAQGLIYIILFKKENKRWQFSFETNQFMDELDESLPLSDLKPIISKYFRNLDLISIVDKNGFAIQFIKNPSEELQLAAVKQDGHARRSVAKKLAHSDQYTIVKTKLSSVSA